MNFRLEIPDGRYTILYKSGDYRTLQFKTIKDGGLAGKQIISYHEPGRDDRYWTGFGFTTPEGGVYFWRRFTAANDEARMRRIRFAVSLVMNDPRKAGMAYAMKEGQVQPVWPGTYGPGQPELSGLGPECARKGHWTKQDQQAVFQAMSGAEQYATA